MNASDVMVVMRKELRETLRDRRTLAVMVLFPLVVYPLVSLLLTEVIAGKQSAAEARPSRVSVVAAGPDTQPAALARVRAYLSSKGSNLALDTPTPPRASSTADATSTTASASADISADRLDALVQVARPERPGTPERVQVSYDTTRESSEKAHARVEAILTSALPPGCVRSYAVISSDTAPRSKVGGYVLSKVLPLIVVVMTMLGAFYPAIDITAGERERGTLETLLSSPVRRFDLMTGKVLAVATLATLTGILNIASMSITVAEGAKLAGGAQSLTIPWIRAAATLLTVVPAAFLFGAVMVAIGAMARGFKEAQTLLAPVYLLCFAPSMIASMADLRLTGLTMLVPGTNLTLLARDLMLAQATFGATVVVLGSTLFYGGLALSFAAHLYDSERLLSSTDADLVGLFAWMRHLIGRDRPADAPSTTASARSAAAAAVSKPNAGDAVTLFGVAFILWFFAFTWLQRWQLIPGLLISQWGGFFGLVWVYARIKRRPLREVLVVRAFSGWGLAGAVMLGLSGWVVLGMLADRVLPAPRHLIEEMRKLIRPPGGERSLALSLFALAVTPALCEEALFRGPILRGLRQRFSLPASCILTGLLFGVLHGDIWRFIPTSILGALLSWVALSCGSIVPSMVIHVLNNGALIILGYYGLDEAAEKLPPGLEAALLATALVLFLAGIACIRRAGRDRARRGHTPQSL
ncbi:MAG: ABC transporter permease subunit/CPBP intramembrane protease [Polyangia bacterium]